MSLDVETVKRRRNVMMIANVIAAVTAVAAIVLYFKLEQSWALVAFILALALGFGAQIWFIMGLRGPRKGT